MRSKEKVTTRDEILRNFTREFLVEEKRRCEIDRYITDFRILIHKRPHENHNYLNRLLQDYTTMFLSHERISVNKMNQEDVKYQLRAELSSRKKDSPKQRYVKSKLSEKNQINSEHQSYLVLKAKTEDFMKKLKEYDELERLAYEIFIENSSSGEMNMYQYEIEPETVLKLKSSDASSDIPHKKYYRNVYVVNSPKSNEKKTENKTVKKGKPYDSNNFAFIKKETEQFLSNNKDYNDAEQKILSQQYQNNVYIKKYVDTLTSSDKPKKESPKRGIFSKIKNMMGISPETSTKFYKNIENNHEAIVDTTKMFLRAERKYNNSEFEAYKLFYIKNGEFQNPLIVVIENIAYEKQVPYVKNLPESGKKIKIKQKLALKASNPNQRSSDEREFEDFNLVKCSPTEKAEPDRKMKDIQFQFEKFNIVPDIRNTAEENAIEINSSKKEFMILREETNNFMDRQKLYEDQQRYYYVIHMRKYHVNPVKEKKESIFAKIKHLFFGRQDKSKEKINYFKEVTQEFLRNEQYHHDLQNQAFCIFSENYGYSPRDFDQTGDRRSEKAICQDSGKIELTRRHINGRLAEKLIRPQKLFEEMKSPAKKETNRKTEKSATLKKQDKSGTPPSLHYRSKSEDLLMFRTKTKSLESKKSPTGHKTLSDRIKSMVGIGNRGRTKSRDMLSPIDPLQYFLDHERFYYDGIAEKQGKYGRSASSIEYLPKDGTIKTKTKRFLSTENVLYQDHKTSSAGKPPSGRRRKEERNRDTKEKKRSRTLSPAQKLVSKIRNMVHKKPEKDKEDVFIRKETENFLTDHRKFNDLLGPSTTVRYRSETDNSFFNDSLISGNDQLVEINNPTLQSPTETMFPKVEKKSIESKKQPTYNVNSVFKIDKTTKKEQLPTTNICDNQKFVNNQTKLFLHDIKQYHDLDKEPNTIDKTIIFINNKDNSTAKEDNKEMKRDEYDSNLSPDIPRNSITMKNMSFESTSKVIERHPEKRTKKIIQVKSFESGGNETSEGSTRIKQNILITETRITNRTSHETVQKTTNKNSAQGWNFSSNKEEMRRQFPESGHTYENISFSGDKPTSIDTTRISPSIHSVKQDALCELRQPNTNIHRSVDVMNTHISANIANLDKQRSEEKGTLPNAQVTESYLKNIGPAHKTGQSCRNEEEKEKYTIRTAKEPPAVSNDEDIEIKEIDSVQNGLEPNENTSPGCQFNVIDASRREYPTTKPETLLRKQTNETVDNEKQPYDDHNKNMNIFVSPGGSLPLKTNEGEQTNLNEPSVMKRRETFQFITRQNDLFLKDHQDYHNTQRKGDKDFLSKTHETDTTITKVKKLMLSQQSEKTFTDEIQHKLTLDQTNEFLRKHQYLIHEEESHFNRTPIAETLVTENVNVNAAGKRESSLDRARKSPQEEVKAKKSTFSKLRSYVTGGPQKPSIEESNKLLRQQSTEFLDNMRKHHDEHKESAASYKVIWLSEKKQGTIEKHTTKPSKPCMNEEEITALQLIRKNTDIFLKDHQDYHNKQRIEDNGFLGKIGKPEHLIWLPSTPTKKKDTIITKVKKLMSPQPSKKSLSQTDQIQPNLIRDQTDEFLRKHQYLIHKEETVFNKAPVAESLVTENVNVKAAEKQRSFLERVKKSPQKEVKAKKSTFSKLKSYVTGGPQKPSIKESNKLLRQQSTEFLDDMRKHHDEHKESVASYKVIWLSEKKQETIEKHPTKLSKPSMNEEEIEALKLIRKDTDIFLKDHQEYHNKQRIEDNGFFGKIGKPEHLTWLSSTPTKKKDTIINKVKKLMSPQQSKRNLSETDQIQHNNLIRDQTDEFLRKHQYLIHKEETIFLKAPIVETLETENVNVIAAEKQRSSLERVEKSPQKEVKAKKSAFSKLRSYVTGGQQKPSIEESNKLLRQQSTEFLDDMRKHHDEHKESVASYKVIWLSEKKQETIEKHPTKPSKPSMHKKEIEALKLIRKDTDIFLKDHQDYHNKQRIGDNGFFGKIGKPEHLIWLSSTPTKKKDTIITKVKKLMSPQQSKRNLSETDQIQHNNLIRDQTDEFLRKHQYLIHKEETIFLKAPIVETLENENVNVIAAEKQRSSLERVEKSPQKAIKAKKSAFSKLRSYVTGGPQKPSIEESNKLLRQQSTEFLDDMRKHHDEHKESVASHKVIWLSEKKQQIIEKHPTKLSRPSMHEKEIEALKLIRKNTDIFLKDHQEYHYKQRIEDNGFFGKIGKPEHLIWLSSTPTKKKDTIITKVKKLMSPQPSKRNLSETDQIQHNLIRDQTDEFLRKHQYLIHKEETIFNKAPLTETLVTENVNVKTADKQRSSLERVENSPQKEVKARKSTFSKLRSYVTGGTQKPSIGESNKLLRQQSTEFLDDMRKHHDEHEESVASHKVIWLSEKKQQIIEKHPTKLSRPSMHEKEIEALKLIRKNTDIFLKDHQDYHNKQRIGDNGFFGKIGKPEHLIWLSSTPTKKKDTIITKVKKLMSPQQSKKSLSETDQIQHNLTRDQTDEFLRKQRYLIHKEETIFNKAPIAETLATENVNLKAADKQKSSPEGVKKSPQKEVEAKKSTFSKLKSYVTGAPQKPSIEESNELLRQQSTEFLDDMRKHHDKNKESVASYKVIWLSEKKQETIEKHLTKPSKPSMNEEKIKALKLVRKNTDIFLKDHQEYHNKQRIEDNGFFGKIGKPEHLIWLSSTPTKEKDTIITKVKKLMSPQQSKKSLSETDQIRHNLIRDQTDEFLRKQRYLIHKEETIFNKAPIAQTLVTENKNLKAGEKQSSSPERVKKSPQKEVEAKKSTFSKLKSYVTGGPQKPSIKETDEVLRKKSTEFLDDMRKHHDEHKESIAAHKVIWLSENKQGTVERYPTEPSKPCMNEEEITALKLIRKNTDIFLKDHQDYHNKQRIEGNEFFGKIGKPEHLIWLSSTPTKKKITKVKKLMSPQQSKKSLSEIDQIQPNLIRDLTDEFLRKHQYFIHKEETILDKAPVAETLVTENVNIKATEKQKTDPKRVEKSPQEEVEAKRSTFSKLKSYVTGGPQKPSIKETNEVLRKQSTEFLDDMRKHHDDHKESIAAHKVIWLSENKQGTVERYPTEPSEPFMNQEEIGALKLIRKNTDIFLKNHQEYHNKQRIEDNGFFGKIAEPKHLIWLSSTPTQKKDTLGTKVKELMSPQHSEGSLTETDQIQHKLIRDQTDEFLRKHQYLIHEEEIVFNKAPIAETVVTENMTENATGKRKSSLDRAGTSPPKEVKAKKSTFSKLKSYVTGGPQKPSIEEFNKLLRQQSTEFLDDMRKHHDEHKESAASYKVIWLSEKKLGTIEKHPTKPSKPNMNEEEIAALKLITKNTDIFLKDHQEYHNKQRIEDNGFFGKIGKPEHWIWLSSIPTKKKDTIITKVKKLMSPQQSKKSLSETDQIRHNLIRDQTDEFLRKQRYLIHKEETIFNKAPIAETLVTENVNLKAAEKQRSSLERVKKSPQKEVKAKKSTFSKLKSYVTGGPQKPSIEESNKLLRQQSTEFLDDMRKHNDEHKEFVASHKVIWLSENKQGTIEKHPTKPSKPSMNEEEIEALKLIRKDTDIFLKDHQEYHNKQRIEDNGFFGKIGKPEHLIWLSSTPTKKKDTIISKVKKLISPQKSEKNLSETDQIQHNNLIRDQTDKFLRKHQYLIHKEETIFNRAPIAETLVTENVNLKAAEKQRSSLERVKKSPQKEVKAKKSTFSKLKSYVTGGPQKPSIEESNKLLRQQSTEFLDDMRKHHDEHKESVASHKVIWLSEKKQGTIEKHPTKTSKPSRNEEEIEALKSIRKDTDIFLKDHQEYHNKQRIDDNGFFGKIGKPEHLIWLSSNPTKKKDTVITKVKKLMSPQQSKRNLSETDQIQHNLIRDQTDEFLRKHQYFIHKEETIFNKAPIAETLVTENVNLKAAEKQRSSLERVKKSPQKEVKAKKSTFSKLKSYVTGGPQKPSIEESNKLLRQQSTKFLDDMRKHHDEHKESVASHKVIWLSEKKQGTIEKHPTKSSKPSMNEEEIEALKLIRKDTDIFLKDHQEYHNKQRIDDNGFFGKIGKPEHLIWLSSTPTKKKKTIITKVKKLMSPQQSKKSLPETDQIQHNLIRDQTDEFLRKHQYFVHKEETIFNKAPIAETLVTENVNLKAADKQKSSPEGVKKSPQKEVKAKKSTFSKLKSYVTSAPQKPSIEESNELLRQQSTEFLDDMRKHHDKNKESVASYKVIWLSEKKQETIEKHLTKPSKPNMNEEKIKALKLVRKNTDIFLKDHQEYHNKQRIEDKSFFGKIGKPEHLIWLSSTPTKNKDTIITKVRKLMSSQQSKKSVTETDEIQHKLIREPTDELSRKQQYPIHKEETSTNKDPIAETLVTEKINIMAAEEQRVATGKEVDSLKLVRNSTDIFLKDHKDYHNRQRTEDNDFSEKMDKTEKFIWLSSVPILPIETEQIVAPAPRKKIISKVKNILSPTKSVDTAIFYYDVDEYKEMEKNQVNPVEFPYNEHQIYDTNPKSYESKNSTYSPIRQIAKKKVTFSECHITADPEVNEFNDQELNGSIDDLSSSCHHDYENVQITSLETAMETNKPQVIPRKQVAKKVKTQFIDSAEIFKQDRDLILIQETRKFLEDHKNHQNGQLADCLNTDSYKERKSKCSEEELLRYRKSEASPEIRSSREELDGINSKETKMKTKLMSKLKSLMGGSQENISPDKKREMQDAVRKQTSEFLISQKCYNDLEGDACYKFSLKQPQEVKLCASNIPQRSDLTFVSEADSTFCFPRKSSDSGSPKYHSKTNQKPQKSSSDEKISKTAKIKTKENSDSVINNERNVTPIEESLKLLRSIEQNENFLDDQRHYISSEYGIWNQYLKYKPEAGSKRKFGQQETCVQKYSQIQSTILTPKESKRKSSAQIESERIDHEVMLHQTKLFLENHKNFHDHLQELSPTYSPKQAKHFVLGDKIETKKGRVLTKIKSFLSSGPNKNHSHHIQKDGSANSAEEKKSKNPKNIYFEAHDEVDRTYFQPEQDVKKLTLIFLKDHQDYHDLERSQIPRYEWKGDDTEKKSKRGVISKIKSLVTGDHKRTSSRKTTNSSALEYSEVNRDIPSTEQDGVSIRELDSSPATYRRKMNPQKSEEQKQETVSEVETIDLEKLSSAGDPKIIPHELTSNNPVNKTTLRIESKITPPEEHSEREQTLIQRTSVTLYDQMKMLTENERKKYAISKIKTQEFLLDQKLFSDTDSVQVNKAPESIKASNNSGKNKELPKESNIADTLILTSEQKSHVTTKAIESASKNTNQPEQKRKDGYLPSAPSLEECGELSEGERENIHSVVHRMVKPLSPTKTIFKEIRKREDSPDRKVYIMKEGYMIKKENKDGSTIDSQTKKGGEDISPSGRTTISGERKEGHSRISTGKENRSKQIGEVSRHLSHIEGSALIDAKISTEGQDYVDRSNDSPSRAVPQGDLEVRRHSTKNCYFIFVVVLVVLIAIYFFQDEEGEN